MNNWDANGTLVNERKNDTFNLFSYMKLVSASKKLRLIHFEQLVPFALAAS